LLVSNGDFYFRHQAADANFVDASNQLIAAADAAHYQVALRSGLATGAVEKPVDFALRNAMVSASGLYALDFFL